MMPMTTMPRPIPSVMLLKVRKYGDRDQKMMISITNAINRPPPISRRGRRIHFETCWPTIASPLAETFWVVISRFAVEVEAAHAAHDPCREVVDRMPTHFEFINDLAVHEHTHLVADLNQIREAVTH